MNFPYPIIRKDGLDFSESLIEIAVAGFDGCTVGVEINWFYSGPRKQNDPQDGRYPWVDINWSGSHSDPKRRKAAPFLAALTTALMIEQYVMTGLIAQRAVAVGVGKSGAAWKVVEPHPDKVFVPVPGYEEVDWPTAAKYVIERNKEANLGLRILHGISEIEVQLKRYTESTINPYK